MAEMSKEAEISIAASSMFPGFKFSPTDEELILYYLHNKLLGFENCVQVISEVDLCKYEPWDLPAKSIINSDREWFFFSPRGKKYPNGSQSKRATETGYWKATGKERSVKSGSKLIGTKRTLVFHIGRAPKGERTEWIMHEYSMTKKGQDALVVCRVRKKCDYQTIDGSNGHITTTDSFTIGSSGTNSGCNLEPVCTTAGNKMAESSLKKSSSSHDSHSIEHLDSASQSNWKANRDDMSQPESSRNEKNQRVNCEDDLFAEILKDNIVQLDECPPPSRTASTPVVTTTELGECPPISTTASAPVVTTTTTSVSVMQHIPGNASIIRSCSQGTANRRIRLRKHRRLSPHKDDLEEQTGENEVPVPTENTNWTASILRGPMRLIVAGNQLFAVLVLTGWLILMVSYVANPRLFTYTYEDMHS
ncbi:hypothetical protein vseg_004163 [Gypsophila vaccaria]